MKDIKDYLHLYLGQKVRYKYANWGKDSWTPWLPTTHRDLEKIMDDHSLSMFELSLRPLSDITEQEKGMLSEHGFEAVYDEIHLKTHTFAVPPVDFILLLSKGFDLFGLIETGLAIDKTKLQTA